MLKKQIRVINKGSIILFLVKVVSKITPGGWCDNYYSGCMDAKLYCPRFLMSSDWTIGRWERSA